MKKFSVKLFLFILLNGGVALGLLEYIYLQDNDIAASPAVTESVLLSTGTNCRYPVLVMGSSHGRNLTRGPNHTVLEHFLKRRVGTIAQSAAGVVPEYLWLQYFYNAGNQTDTILYVIDPFMLYSPKWNEGLYFLTDEPFRWDFFRLLLFSRVDAGVIYNYVQSKFTTPWKEEKGMKVQPEDGSLERIDPRAVNSRLKVLFPDGISETAFLKYARVLKRTVQLANSHQSGVIFIIPPGLLGNLPGKDRLVFLLEDLKRNGKCSFFDFSDSLKGPELYYNHDHLNIRGLKRYLDNCLPLALQNRP
ncbi:MAG: hypothetical protein NTU44_19685 [Bacteroidetes bacterium]|nr:hypothetical protein [Bacteroidota bacterium]